MRILWWLLGLVCGSIPTLYAHPVSSLLASGPHGGAAAEVYPSGWLKYMFGLFTVVVVSFTIIGCLCCKRHRHPKGFQEFKDGHTSSGCDLTFENPVSGLELEVPRAGSRQERISFEPLPLDCLASQINNYHSPKPKLPHSTPLTLDQNWSVPVDSCNEWFDSSNHIPREKLKYLREIGHGWFGKVVEGRADLEDTNTPANIIQNKGVIVRILTEEATSQEKSWFLREATPYLKLRHRNILSLLGACLETDPYLLLFESCPRGDLKGFLRSNCDCETREALVRGNIPKKMAMEIAAGLEHMHTHGLAHTDLAARNCLVASDLSIKLGDYGTSIEKYPIDYYVVGDRALPIRWAAPESLKCTDTTIETLEITVKANLWSYAVLLWEIVTWGKRPYDSLCDEEVIQIVLSSTHAANESTSRTNCSELLLKCPEDCPQNLYHVMRLCWTIDPTTRPGLDQVLQVLEARDFELRWETLRPNTLQEQGRSASLFNLHGSIDSDSWISPHVSDSLELTNNNDKILSTSFRLGPEEPVKNVPGIRANNTMHESDSETEEESWLDRVKRGAYTEKVRQKSKSVADLMILVHIDSDSDADWSIGIQGPEQTKKKLTSAGSDSNLRSTVLADEFTEALKKLRNPTQTRLYNHSSFDDSSICKTVATCDNSDTTNVLTLTTDVERRPMLRLSSPVIQLHTQSKNECLTSEIPQKSSDCNNLFVSEDLHKINEIPEEVKESPNRADVFKLCSTQSSDFVHQDNIHSEEHILRLVPKSNPCPPLLRLVPDANNALEQSQVTDISSSQKSRDASDAVSDSFIDNEDQRMIDRKDGETQGLSNNCDNNFEFHSNDQKNETNEVKQCNIDSENSAIRYSENSERVESLPLLNENLLKSDNSQIVESRPSETNTESDGVKVLDSETQQNISTPIDFKELITEGVEEMVTVKEKPLVKEEPLVEEEPLVKEEPLVEEISSPEIISSTSSNENSPKVGAVQEDDIHKSNISFAETSPQLFVTMESGQNAVSPTTCRTENSEDNFSNGGELEIGDRVGGSDVATGGEDAKRLSTPDDERSSDSGFRDKESCEEEESPAAATHPLHLSLLTAEEEHLHVISELDAILDAESPGNFLDLDDMEELLSPDSIERKVTDLDDPKSDECTGSIGPGSLGDGEGWFLHPREKYSQQLLRSNSDTNADVEDNIDSLASDIQRLESQNLNANLPAEVQEYLESPDSSDITRTNISSDHTMVPDHELESPEKFEEKAPIVVADLEYPADKEGNGSTESLHSDNSYISFGLDEEYVVAIRKELSEKLPHAQMPVEETPEPCDTQDLVVEDKMSVMNHEPWNDEEASAEQGSGVIDISIRYNVYNTPLSPILEERETFSIITSESLASKDSYEESLASKQSESPNDDVDEDDLLMVDVATNEAVLLAGDRDVFTEAEKEDQDTSNVDVSDDENFEYRIVMPDSMQEPTKQLHIVMGGSAPLPSPEDELKWQQLSLSFPLPLQDDLMSTSFTTKHDWDSQDEDNSSSSGEFVWKEGERMSPRCTRSEAMDQFHDNLGMDGIKEEAEGDGGNVGDAEEEGEGDEEDEEFTPSAWDATLAPHRSALRSPDKTQRPDQKKSVWFKKQRYHCVYEYPKEASTANNQEQPITNWEPTSYADWEELMEEPRLDLYPLEYDESDENVEEFYVSSSNRPFQFQTGDGEQVSQFFPGATSSLLQRQQQLGELRHTRDRLKLNLPLTESQAAGAPTTSPAEERQERLTDELDLDALGACKAEISLEKEMAEDTTISQEKQNEVRGISPSLLKLDDQSVA